MSNRFGWAVFPVHGEDTAWQIQAPAGLEHGLTPVPKSVDEVRNQTSIPTVAYYRTRVSRDSEMQALARRYPGIMFVPFEVSEGLSYPAAKNPSRFTFSDKGILPA